MPTKAVYHTRNYIGHPELTPLICTGCGKPMQEGEHFEKGHQGHNHFCSDCCKKPVVLYQPKGKAKK